MYTETFERKSTEWSIRIVMDSENVEILINIGTETHKCWLDYSLLIILFRRDPSWKQLPYLLNATFCTV